jgi:hypothetical protein
MCGATLVTMGTGWSSCRGECEASGVVHSQDRGPDDHEADKEGSGSGEFLMRGERDGIAREWVRNGETPIPGWDVGLFSFFFWVVFSSGDGRSCCWFSGVFNRACVKDGGGSK